MQSENLIWQLIARSLSGEASREEIALLDEHLQNDDALRQQYTILKHFWCSSKPVHTNEKESNRQIEKIFEKAGKSYYPDATLQHRKRKLLSRQTFAISFVSLIITVAAIVFFYSNNIKSNISSRVAEKNSNTVVTQNGNRIHIVLPDGSLVWVNAGSVLNYQNFTRENRQVYLKGEAFFDVMKDAGHPFIVHANSIDIKVLGTAFNVKSYSEENKVEATLIRGIIQVTRNDKTDDKPVFLHPNEKLIIDLKEDLQRDILKQEYTKPEPVFKLYHLDSMIKTENLIETSWIYNKLEFRGDNFEELAKKLERWYNIKIYFEDDVVKKLNFNGSFESETVHEAFEALKVAVPFEYIIKGDEVYITSSK